MAQEASSLDKHCLTRFIPLNALLSDDLDKLAKSLRLEEWPAGSEIELSNIIEKIYLWQGKVSLYQGQRLLAEIDAAEQAARYALNRNKQRGLRVRVDSPAQLFRVDLQACSAGILPGKTAPSPTAPTARKARPVPPSKSAPGNSSRRNPWLEKLLNNPLFRQLPPGHLRRLIAALEEKRLPKGATVLEQGKTNTQFFVIKKGQCAVVQETAAGREVLNTLGPGSHFGSTTLLAEMPQAVSVEMLGNGELMCLSQKDFYRWLIYPLNRIQSYRRCREQLSQGACWLDVRSLEEYQAGHLRDSIHLPLDSMYLPLDTLQMMLPELQTKRRYLLYSNHNHRATAALFRLLPLGFDVMVLEDNFSELPREHLLLPQVETEPEPQAASQEGEAAQAEMATGGESVPEVEYASQRDAAFALLVEARAEAERVERERATAQQQIQAILEETENLLPKAEAEVTAVPDLDPLIAQPNPALRTESRAEAVPSNKRLHWLLLLLLIASGLLWLSGLPDIQKPLGQLLADYTLPSTASVEIEELPTLLRPGLVLPQGELSEAEKARLLPPHLLRKTFREKLRDGGLGPIMIALPAGEFLMGSPPGKPYPDEQPQTLVRLPRFAMSIYEISFEDFRLFTEATQRPQPNDFGWGRGRQPIINVTWGEATAYAAWLSEQTGQTYRLPTEREWEYAAAATTRSAYWWGNQIKPGIANCAVCGSPWDTQQAAPVGSFPANHFGLYDTAGNVKEWIGECRHADYSDMPTNASPWPGGDCSQYPLRGGSYRTYQKMLRTTNRDYAAPQTRSDEIGFRVMRLVE